MKTQQSPHDVGVMWALGFVGSAGLIKWRTPDGRGFADDARAVLVLPYDAFPLARDVRSAPNLSNGPVIAASVTKVVMRRETWQEDG